MVFGENDQFREKYLTLREKNSMMYNTNNIKEVRHALTNILTSPILSR